MFLTRLATLSISSNFSQTLEVSGVVANLELGERRTMEGLKVPSEARSRSPSPVWGLGAMPPEKFSKNQP